MSDKTTTATATDDFWTRQFERETQRHIDEAAPAGFTVREEMGMWRVYDEGRQVAMCIIRADAARVAVALARMSRR